MVRQQLSHLYKYYLRRDCTDQEWKLYGHLNYHDFEKQIRNGEEYLFRSGVLGNVAILLSGHIRKNSILEGLLKYAHAYNFDVFVHTWDTIGMKGEETNLNSQVLKDNVQKELDKLPNLVKYKIENNKDYIDGLPKKTGYWNFSSPEPFIKSQLYSINQSFELMEEHTKKTGKKYETIVKLRFDCEIDSFKLTHQVVEDYKNHNIIFVPEDKISNHSHEDYGTSCWACDNMYHKFKLKEPHVFEHTNIICDLFAFGGYEGMKKYCNLYNVYDEINEEFDKKNQETLKKLKTDVQKVDGNYKFLGPEGHRDTLYYYYCSYPERMLQQYLSDYMLPHTNTIKAHLVR